MPIPDLNDDRLTLFVAGTKRRFIDYLRGLGITKQEADRKYRYVWCVDGLRGWDRGKARVVFLLDWNRRMSQCDAEELRYTALYYFGQENIFYE